MKPSGVSESRLTDRQHLRGPWPVLALPTGRPQPARQHGRRARQSLALAQDLLEALQELSRQEEVTLFMTLLAAFKALLHRYTGQDDILVGSLLAQNTRAERKEWGSPRASTLVLCTDLSGNPTFRELLRRIKGVVAGAAAYQDFPFAQPSTERRLSWDLGQTHLLQVLFSLEESPQQPLKSLGLEPSRPEIEHQPAQSDLSLRVQKEGAGLRGVVDYNAALFDEATITRLVGHLHTLLEEAVANPDARLATLPLLTAAEREQLLVTWNATDQDFPRDQCLQHLVEAQVARTPTAVAVLWEGQSLTYQELNARANQLAHYLKKHGVGPGVLVGLCLERSLDMVVGMLGILKAGGAYVPLDPVYPQERLAFMLADAQVRLLLTQHRLGKTRPAPTARVVCLDTDWPVIARERQDNPDGAGSPDDLAYVIYTSGSTGKPKGVQVLQRGVVNCLWALRHRPGLTAQDTVLAVTTISFDIAAVELWLPLIVGARVVLLSREAARDGQRLQHAVANSGATVMQATPATWRLLLEAGWVGSPALTLWCGGEALSAELAVQLLPKARALWNLYGPTETTIWSTLHRVTGEPGPIPIGRPMANTECYILDPALAPVPVGVTGELYIGGAGVARGYLNRPEVTAERFIPHPFCPEPGARLYKTGDLVRYRPDGNIEFLGRRDTQVKLRGFRIELGEIEAACAHHPAVRQVVVVAREERPGDQRLVAYLVSAQQPAPSPQALRHFLQERLPDYMIPAAFVWLDALPLTPNGKVDRRALPAPAQPGPQPLGAGVAPRDRLERQLVNLWEKALGIAPIGIQDDFFALGGHSLLAARLCEQMEQRFGKNLSPATLFQAPTIERLAHLLRQGIESVPSWSLVVPFHAEGTKPPFFCLFSSVHLALWLGTEQPVYALQPHGLAGRRAPATVEATAAAYLDEVRALQPRGPYFLGGFSFGGLVVFEMAQQLLRQGQQVTFLALLDPPPPPQRQGAPTVNSPPRTSLPKLASVRAGIVRHADVLARLGPQAQLAYVGARVMGKLLPAERRLKQLVCQLYLHCGRRLPMALRAFYFLETSRAAAQGYVPQVYPGRLILFRTPHSAPQLQAEWQSLALQGVEVYEVPGNHLDIIKEPYVRTLAEKLQTCLAQTQAGEERHQASGR